MEAAIFSQAMREYLRPRRLLPWILLALVCALLAYFWGSLDSHSAVSDRYSMVSSMLVFRLLALMSAIFTTAIVSQEVEQKTIVYLLTRPVPRWKLLLVRFLASVIVVALVGAFTAAVTSFGAHHGLVFDPLFGKDMVAILFGAVAYGSLFLFVSLLFNRALIICALYAFGWEASMPNMPGGMSQLSIFSYLQALNEHPSGGDNGILSALTGSAGTNTLTRGTAVATLVIMIVVLLGISAWWFGHFEYVPREDAE